MTLAFTTQKRDQKIAAFGSSYRKAGCIQLEIGRLSGRHRWQASSHRRAKARSKDRSLRQLLQGR
ncbi:hypothetical protein DBR18_10075 [Pseudomonas sp. HMWF021]|nr:hypothetical protein DBR18_10075 [Pseudomonas sp. HMWF021]